MASNRRIALHFDTTGYKNGLENQEVIRIQAVTFGKDSKPEEFQQIFMPSCSISKTESKEHGYTKTLLKKLKAPVFSTELGAKFVAFVGDSEAYSDAPWKTKIVNNALRNAGVEPLPKLNYTYTSYKELHPEKRHLCKNGQHPLSMITQDYKVSDDIQGAYRVASVVMQMEAALKERAEKSSAVAQPKKPLTCVSSNKDEKHSVAVLANKGLFKPIAKPIVEEIPFEKRIGLYGMKIA